MRKTIGIVITVAIVLIGFSAAQAGFIVNDDGTVTDTATGLMWKRATEPSQMNWATAMNHCDNMDFAGYTDWRLPSKEELQTLIRYESSPTIDTVAFPDTAAYIYWSSLTSNSYEAWYRAFFSNGYWGTTHQSNYANVRAVRSGQSGSLGHLVILTPKQLGFWGVGTNAAINWETQSVPGNVKISLSKEAGKDGTWETIIESTPNDGGASWIVTGPQAPFKASIKIEPYDAPEKTVTLGLFSIVSLDTAWLNVKRLGAPNQARLETNGAYSGDLVTFDVSATTSDPAIATIDGSTLSGLQNGHVTVSTPWGAETLTKRVYVHTTHEDMESEPNNTDATASAMSPDVFYTADMFSGDVDYYSFSLGAASVMDLAYLSYSETADMKVEIFNQAGTRMAWGTSTNGEPLTVTAGLPAGNYTAKVTANGDIDQANYYVLTRHVVGALPVKANEIVAVGQTKTGAIHNLTDQNEYSLFLAQEAGIKFLLTPRGQAKYKLELVDGQNAVIRSVDATGYLPVFIEAYCPAGGYTLRVKPIDEVDAEATFSLALIDEPELVEDHYNDGFDHPSAIAAPGSVTGRLFLSTDADIYTFTLATPQYLNLAFATDSTASYAVTLYKESSENLIDGLNSTSGAEVSANMGLAVGRYYLKVAGSGTVDTVNTYTLTLSQAAQTNLEIESNNTLKFANALDKTTARSGRIYSTQDLDYFGFHLDQSGIFTVTFTPTSATGDYLVTLVDENDAVISQRTASNGGAQSIMVSKPAGNYFIKVQTAGDIDQTTPYQVSLTSDKPITGLKQLVAVTVAGASGQMTAGTNQALTATASYSDATSEAIATPVWSSLNTAVATVDAGGNVAAIAQGTTSIVASHGGISGKFDITVGAPVNVVDQHYGNLIVVAGGGAAADNTLWPTTNYLSDLVYLRFRNRLFTDTDIHYLNPVSWHDIDGDGFDNAIVDDTSPTVAELGAAITSWAVSQSTDGPLYIYLIDHGGIDTFNVFPGQILTAAQLKGFVDAFQTATNRKVVVMIEACKSGSFTNDLVAAGQNRVAVTCTDAGNAYQQLNGRISFTQFFIDRLLTGNTVYQAFTSARNSLANLGLPYNQMAPQLAEGVFAAASATRVGGDFAIAGLFPEITGQSPSTTVAANAGLTLWAQLADLSGIDAVWAVVVPPNYSPPPPSADLESPQVALPTVTLTDADKNGVYEAAYSDFAYSGEYRITFYAKNTTGNVTVSTPMTVTVTGGISTDTDSDGLPDAWETTHFGNLDQTAAGDPDNDGLTNLAEYQHNTLPTNPDTDGDAMPDGWEVSHSLDPNRNDAAEDADADGVTNVAEYTDGTDPQNNASFVVHAGTISARVITTVTGQTAPIKNAAVTLQGTAHSATSGPDGMVSLSNVPTGTYTLKVNATNFAPYSGQVTLTSAGLALGDITLNVATSTGVAGDASGNGVLGMEDAIWVLQVITGIR